MLRNFRTQEEQFLSQLKTNIPKNSAGDNLLKELLGEIGAEVTDEYLGSPQAGRKFVRSYLNSEKQKIFSNVEQSIRTQHERTVNQILDFLRGVSERRSKQTKPNSNKLMKKIIQAQKFIKIETRISKTILALQEIEITDLIYNKDIESDLSSDYDQLRNLEKSLRSFIQKWLSSISSNWWKEFIPNDVRDNAEKRKTHNEILWPWHSASGLHPIHFIDFADYSKIISRKDNWKNIFKRIFGGESPIIATKLKELEPIRHSIAHSRSLSRDESKKLALYSKEICKMIQGRQT